MTTLRTKHFGALWALLSCLPLPAIGAAGLPAIPLDTPHPVEIVLAQQEITVSVPDNSAYAMQGGLIGALVGAAVSNAQVKNAEERIATLRDVLIDYPFNARVEAALRAKLAEGDVLAGHPVEILHAGWSADAPNASAATGEVLVLTPGYAVNNDFDELAVDLDLAYVRRSLRSNGKPVQKILFQRTYAFRFPLQDTDDPTAAEDWWLRWPALGEPALAAMLDQGIEHVTDMLVHDLSAAGREEAALPTRRQRGTVQGIEYRGRMVRQGADWIWLRTGNPPNASLLGYRPVAYARAPANADAPVAPVDAGADASFPVSPPGSDDAGGDTAPATPEAATPTS